MKLRKQQQGLTMISILFLMAIVIFFIVLGMKIGPVYLENSSIKGILESLPSNRSLKTSTPKKIRRVIAKKFNINSIYNYDKYVSVKKKGGKITVTMPYEVRKNVVGNLDVIMAFDEKIEW